MDMTLPLSALALLLILYAWASRPKLNPEVDCDPPEPGTPQKLKQRLEESERLTPNLVEGAGASVHFANPDDPQVTKLVFLYVHGFSATWRETAPVTDQLAGRFDANSLHCRIAGHGTGTQGMKASAEDWLASLKKQAEIASLLGEKMIVVGVSTGAPLSVWLSKQTSIKDKIAGLLFMSPNFKIRPGLGFLLTSPLPSLILRAIFSKRYRSWEPMNEEQAKYWTTRQPLSAVIEMQKVVDWANLQDLSDFKMPLATIYMPNDPTINSEAAIKAHNEWGATHKMLKPVEPDGEAIEHVFCGDICGPNRTQWTVDVFARFLEDMPDEATEARP